MSCRIGIVTVVAVGVLGAAAARAADHREAPLLQLDTRADINDLYVFQSPEASSNLVLIMTTNPVAGVLSPLTFSSGVNFAFEIYHDGASKPAAVFKIGFRKPRDGQQLLEVRFKNGDSVAEAEGAVGQTIDLGRGGRLAAGLFDDPFFMDVVAFSNGTLPGGQDFYRGTNTLGLVLEVPITELAPPGTGIGVRGVARKGQVDSVGRPLVSRLFLPADLRDAFNKTKPSRQDRFAAAMITGLVGDYGQTEAANLVQGFLLPDILPFDAAQASGFPNGRRLEDDVVDAMLVLATNGRVTSDGVAANDVAFRPTFPYLAAPHRP